MSRRRNRVRSLRNNRLNAMPRVSPMDEGDSESVVSSTTDVEPRKVKPLIIKRTWTKIEPPTAGSPPTLVLRSIPGGNQGSRKYNVEVAKLLLRLNTSASTKGDEPTERAVSSSSRDDDSHTEEMSSDVDENYLAMDNDEDEMTENDGVDDKVQNLPHQPPAQVGICEVCQTQMNIRNPLENPCFGTRRIFPIVGHGPAGSDTATQQLQHFKCKSCGIDFSRRGNLVIHLRVHNERRLYDCSFEPCQKSFQSISELSSHERTHAVPQQQQQQQQQQQRSPRRDFELNNHNLRVSSAQEQGGRIALRIFKAESGASGAGSSKSSSSNNRWNSADLINHVQQQQQPSFGASRNQNPH